MYRAKNIRKHNLIMRIIARKIQRELKESSTEAEHLFEKEVKRLGIKLRSQYKIEVPSKDSSYIKCFYFADFCDTVNKIVFEVDGGYHNDAAQRRKDERRTRDLRRLGYKVYRIPNEDVFAGKTKEFVFKVYMDIGIRISL